MQGWQAHKHLLTLAFPMILANSTTPLLGLVDTAVMGHMDSAAMLAGASIGALILTQLYWVCGFLRMSTTGLSAQAKGNPREPVLQSAKVLWQTAGVAALLGLVIVALQWPLWQVGMGLAAPPAEVATHAQAYFSVRVWGAPAALLNLVLIGWLVGQQKTRTVLVIQVVGNLLNAVSDLVLVLGLQMSVPGVALASVLAEYAMMGMAGAFALRMCAGVAPHRDWFNAAARRMLLKLNGNMLIRNLALQACLAFVTLQGARLGETAAAVNALLMQFFVLIALGLDGIAYAVEALVGEAVGAGQAKQVVVQTQQGLLWSTVFALVYAVGFFSGGPSLLRLLTDLDDLYRAALPYLPLMVALPLLAHWCFLFDGVFVGLTRSAPMRDTMVVSALLVFFPVWWFTRQHGNVALWYAMLAFLLARGITLGGFFWRLTRRQAWLR
ncbi:multidrug resistance protein, MATE family [Catalinimonas alkaloidigena]|uniref:Multidrug resistance protein, MATE family n=1 Tax=Catalinimonas alkaloidigena TaxID=1075417 RepID=A0A1G9HK79_9BACT|nr:multidrug resistance protein, MATE family [Catalinimonas alkaloidigena]